MPITLNKSRFGESDGLIGKTRARRRGIESRWGRALPRGQRQSGSSWVRGCC